MVMERYFCHKILPAVFDDSLSYYEVVCKLTSKVNEIIELENDLESKYQELASRMQDAESNIENIYSEIAAIKLDIAEKYTYLLDLIKKLMGNSLQYDVQHGTYEDTMTAQRDMFNDVTVHGIEIGTLNELDLDVEGLSECGLNVRGLAVMGLWLLDNFDIPDYFKADKLDTIGIITPIDLRDGVIKNGFFMKDVE